MLAARAPLRLNPGLVVTLRDLPPTLAHWLARQPGESFAAGQTLIAPDATPAHVWFLRSGLVRQYSLDAAGSVFNHDFLGDGGWVFGRLAWRAGQVCCSERALGADALQTTHAVRVSLAELDRWRSTDPQVAAYLMDALLQFAAARYEREAELVQLSAEQRYRKLVAARPQVLDTVPLKEIAAWLAITPVALSRIRKRVRSQPA